MSPNPKPQPVRDRKYLDHLRTERCVFTLAIGNDSESVVPAHIGTFGMGAKSSDDEVLPCSNTMHNLTHRLGFAQVVRQFASNDLILAAFRAYARERYRAWRGKRGENHGEHLDA